MAINPVQRPPDEDTSFTEPRTAWDSSAKHRGPRWWWTVLAIVALVVAGVILYFVFYGGSSSTPSSSSGGGYALLALSADQLRRIRNRVRISR